MLPSDTLLTVTLRAIQQSNSWWDCFECSVLLLGFTNVLSGFFKWCNSWIESMAKVQYVNTDVNTGPFYNVNAVTIDSNIQKFWTFVFNENSKFKLFNRKWIKYQHLFVSFLGMHAMNELCIQFQVHTFKIKGTDKWADKGTKIMKNSSSDAWAASIFLCEGIRNSKRLETYEESIWMHACERIFYLLVRLLCEHTHTQILHMKINKCLLFDVEFWK